MDRIKPEWFRPLLTNEYRKTPQDAYIRPVEGDIFCPGDRQRDWRLFLRAELGELIQEQRYFKGTAF